MLPFSPVPGLDKSLVFSMRLVYPYQGRSLLPPLLGKFRSFCTIHNTCHKTQIIHSFLCITTKIQICEF
nr:MAG TPA: hypothetical protein [Caudoviricetes sp.]